MRLNPFCTICLLGTASVSIAQGVREKPNVILIITDDQGYGDFGFTGNPHVKTPVLDNFARQSIRFNNFYVCPVSAPTRSSLMTGRYSLRTGVRDTNNGGAIMASTEITIAEVLKDAGYATGQFGKWHLGDNYPFRPIDQGFDESLMHLGGGIGQPGDITTYFRGDSSYFDPVLWHNGSQESYSGYCSDIFADQAIRFIENNRANPFFCYLAFNAPHVPLQVPERYYNMYRDIDPSRGFEIDNRPFPQMTEKDREDARKVYAMVSNIDDNVGRLLRKLEELHIAENTIVIFMTDNGPQQRRYNAGMRGLKTSVYRGGIRVPFWIRYPAMKTNIADIDFTAAAIDLLPTIASLCNAPLPANVKIDGINLFPFIKGEKKSEERTLFFYWTRHSPELYTNIALQKGSYKLVGNTDYNSSADKFELFDIGQDPFEQNNIVKDQPDRAAEMKKELDIRFRELAGSENLIERPRIEVGSVHENPVILNRNDADGQWGIWDQEDIFGLWRVIINEGRYNLSFRFIEPVPSGGKMIVETGVCINQLKNDINATYLIEMKNVYLPSLKCDFVPFYLTVGRRILPLYIEIEKIK
jgi:arylsulfatase A-like enzyme